MHKLIVMTEMTEISGVLVYLVNAGMPEMASIGTQLYSVVEVEDFTAVNTRH